MGCAQSRLDNEESVSRCKERRNLMKDAVAARNAFAAGHSGYAIALKNTGAALSDYGHGEISKVHLQQDLQPPLDISTQPQPPPPPPQFDNLPPPPPPPPPNFSPSPVKRSTSMPEIMLNQHRRPYEKVSFAIAEEAEEEQDEKHGQETKGNDKNTETTPNNIKKNLGDPHVGNDGGGPKAPETPPMPEAKSMAWDYFFMVDNMPGSSLDPEPESEPEEDEDANNAENVESVGYSLVEPQTPEKLAEEKEEAEVVEEEENKQLEHSKTAPADFRKAVAKGFPSVNLTQVLGEIDDQFLKASESAQEVAKMLEATKLHYHSNFADNRG